MFIGFYFYKDMYRTERNYENTQKAIYAGIGEYHIPQILPVKYDGCKWIGFNYAKSAKDRVNSGIHFFLDDYQFIRVWNGIDNYIDMLQQFKYVMTPDFSLYTDFPKALQIYNHYRKHWLGAYMQDNGINVIPTIAWSDKDSYEWCFDGEPTQSVVAISSVGCMNNREARNLFIDGYAEMVSRLNPEQIIFYGEVPDECKGNIVQIKTFQDKFKEAKCNGW